MSSRQLYFVAATDASAYADGTGFTVVMSLFCCLAEGVTAQLRFTISKTGTSLFSLRPRKKLFSMAAEQ